MNEPVNDHRSTKRGENTKIQLGVFEERLYSNFWFTFQRFNFTF